MMDRRAHEIDRDVRRGIAPPDVEIDPRTSGKIAPDYRLVKVVWMWDGVLYEAETVS